MADLPHFQGHFHHDAQEVIGNRKKRFARRAAADFQRDASGISHTILPNESEKHDLQC
jgi:hypothetical protein